ncbi:hypothetical protein EPUL_005064 [Erysiphe pulchra]|uniref:Uncharacterized protein n=1 Tax=Erysiphe pulchra TaxID=225359 RepID=A0A2S4PM41_9PEZI|nr:hypothetical protein EPUL_005064 [Erysiphe pulchra]
MAEPMETGNTLARFSYVDDIGILGIGRTVTKSVAVAQQEVNSILELADTKKSEIIKIPNQCIEAQTNIQGFVLQRGGINFNRGRGILHGGEVFDAELYGATAALHAALSVRQTGVNIFILLDNQAAIILRKLWDRTPVINFINQLVGHNGQSDVIYTHAHLPKELAEIYIARKQQERAWQTRLLVFKSLFSCMENTRASFKEGEEKELAKKIHAHLRIAISQFAISETCAPPLEVLQQTKGVKFNGIPKMNLPKRPTVAVTHFINATLKTTNALPKTLVRNGQKKTRLNVALDATIDTNLQPQKSAAQTTFKLAQNLSLKNKRQSKRTDDMRLFCPLVERPGMGLSSIGAKLEPAISWLTVIIPTVSRYIRTEKGQVEVTKELLLDEIERVTSMRPNSIKLYGHSRLEATHRTWLALFIRAPRPGFCVFDESGMNRIFKKQPLSDLCKRCNGHHSPKNYSRALSCGNCGSTMHSEDLCMALTKCSNYGCPHRSDSRKCLARPTCNGAPTKEQLKIFRQAGDRVYQAVVRAKAAEERASVVEGNSDEAPSQPEYMVTGNSQASSSEAMAGNAMHL